MTFSWPLRFALGVLVLFVLIALVGPFLIEHDPLRGSLRTRLVPPAWVEGGSFDHEIGRAHV